MDADSFEEKLSFRLTRLGVISITFLLILLFLIITTYLIVFTSLREYIPGYADVTLPVKIYRLQVKADSMELACRQNLRYIDNLKRIISGDSILEYEAPEILNIANYDTISMSVSPEDLMLRAEYEAQNKFNLYQNRSYNYLPQYLGDINFFPPLSGIVTRSFDPAQQHYGIDIVARESEVIKAVLEGTVIFSDWTLETGYIIALQHKNNLISVYKHNSSVLKQEGMMVKAGETISIVGESGELTTGPHLHFELWYNGKPVDPAGYISF